MGTPKEGFPAAGAHRLEGEAVLRAAHLSSWPTTAHLGSSGPPGRVLPPNLIGYHPDSAAGSSYLERVTREAVVDARLWPGVA